MAKLKVHKRKSLKRSKKYEKRNGHKSNYKKTGGYKRSCNSTE